MDEIEIEPKISHQRERKKEDNKRRRDRIKKEGGQKYEEYLKNERERKLKYDQRIRYVSSMNILKYEYDL